MVELPTRGGTSPELAKEQVLKARKFKHSLDLLVLVCVASGFTGFKAPPRPPFLKKTKTRKVPLSATF